MVQGLQRSLKTKMCASKTFSLIYTFKKGEWTIHGDDRLSSSI